MGLAGPGGWDTPSHPPPHKKEGIVSAVHSTRNPPPGWFHLLQSATIDARTSNNLDHRLINVDTKLRLFPVVGRMEPGAYAIKFYEFLFYGKGIVCIKF